MIKNRNNILKIINEELCYYHHKLQEAKDSNNKDLINYYNGAINAIKGIKTELGYPEQRLI